MARPRPKGVSKSWNTREYKLPYATSAAKANYAYPRGAGKDRGKRPSYPIVPKSRARAARERAAQRKTAGTLSHVDAAIRKRYGSVQAIYGGSSKSGRSSNRSRTTRRGR